MAGSEAVAGANPFRERPCEVCRSVQELPETTEVAGIVRTVRFTGRFSPHSARQDP